MFLYIYSPSDFTAALPDEEGTSAAGSPTFTLTLVAGATPTVIEVSDNDAIFAEIPDSQTLVSTVNIDGTTYTAGTQVSTAYDLINTTTGHKVTSVHFGGNGYQQGAVHGMVSSIPLEPGQTYTFDTERSSWNQGNRYDDYVACFARGTRIATADGPRRIESLREGDPVLTLDNGVQHVKWVARTTVRAEGPMAPIRFEAGAIGNARVLYVSPEHRMLVRDPKMAILFGKTEALVAAKELVNGDTITRMEGGNVTYFHLLFDKHEIVWAEGVPSEAFFVSEQSLKGLAPTARFELMHLFPDLCRRPDMPAARTCLKSFEAQVLLAA